MPGAESHRQTSATQVRFEALGAQLRGRITALCWPGIPLSRTQLMFALRCLIAETMVPPDISGSRIYPRLRAPCMVRCLGLVKGALGGHQPCDRAGDRDLETQRRNIERSITLAAIIPDGDTILHGGPLPCDGEMVPRNLMRQRCGCAR